MRKPLALLLVACAAVAACSRSMSSQDYFSALAEQNQSLDARAERARSDAQAALTNATTPSQAKAALMTFLEELNSIGDDAYTSLQDLDPPDELRAAHEAYLRETRDLTGAILVFKDAAAAADPAEVESATADARATVEAKTAALEAACADLQDEAGAAGINTDLSCDQTTAPEAPAR